MDTNQKKAGRPKAPPRTGPLVLAEGQARTNVTFEISERAAEELAEYAHWVARCSAIAPNEAKFKTVDFALREIFRRDRVWQAERRAPSEPPKIAPRRRSQRLGRLLSRPHPHRHQRRVNRDRSDGERR